MSVREPMLTDEQWSKIEPLIPKRPKSRKGGGPPADDRHEFEGVLWILKTGARWKDLPDISPASVNLLEAPQCIIRRRSARGYLADVSLRFGPGRHPGVG
jgi:transposase